jgi:hypothetical protein
MAIQSNGEGCIAVKLRYEELSRGRVNPFSVSKLSAVILLFFFVVAFTEQCTVVYLMRSQ